MPATRTADCPPKRLIVDFSRGKLDDAAAETVSAHLETCIDCRASADNVEADSFIHRLRAAHGQISAVAPFTSQADSVSRANSATATFKSSSPSVSPPEGAKLSVPPELVDHPDYEVLKELGRGGMGVVYLARNRAMDRLEVLKVVSRSLLEKPDARERFQREIRAAAKLSHPNIVTAHSVPRAGDLLIFAMEYIEGSDLSQVVKQRGPLPVINAVYYAHQAALGLQHAHEHGMVHRDIKPNNLILSVQAKRHLVKILDFGLAKATSEKLSNSELTGSGQILGTPDYMAPEQSLDAQKADIRADIYSLGCTLYYMLAGRPPFEGPSLYALLAAHHSNTARRLNELRSEVPAELAAVVAKMMVKDPAHRYQTPAQVSQALGPFYRAAGGEAAKLTPLTVEADLRDTRPEVFDPYYQWLGIAPEEQPVDHYRLLGAKRFEPNPEVIANLADQRTAHLRSFQRGEHAPLAQKLLGEIAAARVCLLKPDRKAAYDAELRRTIPAPPQATPSVAAPLAPPLAAVEALDAASPPELSPARKAAAWAKRATASLSTRLGVHRFPPAVRYTALGSFAALIVLCAVIIKFSTPDGDVTVEVSKPAAEVTVEGQTATVHWDSGTKKAEVSVPPGSHKVEITSDGIKAAGQQVAIEQEGRPVIAAKLDPPAESARSAVANGGRDGEGAKPWKSAAFQQWMKDVAAMPAEKQIDAVVRKLQELNRGFDGKETHTIENGVVTELQFVSDAVSDISPVRALTGLTNLLCQGSGPGKGVLSDLSPLQGMKLTNLICYSTRVSDLSPLKGTLLTEMNCGDTPVSDLSPLKGMRLTLLHCDHTLVSDLSPLEGMPLRELHCWATRVSNLSPLRGMPLATLWCGASKISDLSPLKRMPLTDLYCGGSQVSDLSPLKGMPLKMLSCGYTSASDLSPLKGMPLTELNCGYTPASDLSPLAGMALTGLIIDGTKVSDLSPLQGMSISTIGFTPKNITKGLDVIRRMKSIKTLGTSGNGEDQLPPEEFWKKYDAGDFGKPDAAAATSDQKGANAGPNAKATPPQLIPGTATPDNPSKPLKFPLDQWVDLLPMIDTTANAVRGDWAREGTDITVTQGGDASALSLPVSADGSYDFEVSFKRTDGDGAIAAMLSIDSHPCTVVLSGGQGAASGVMNLDGRPPNDAKNPTGLRPAPLENGHMYKLLASVRIYSKHRASLDISLDGRPYLPHWEGDPAALGADAAWVLLSPRHLGIGAQSAAKFYSARLRIVAPFEQWLEEVAAQPPLVAVESVTMKLRDLNPAFHGKVSHRVENGVVTQIGFNSAEVADISPLRALTGLTLLLLANHEVRDNRLALQSNELWPAGDTRVSDLSPLKGLPLKVLVCDGSLISDLSPLEGMPLRRLVLRHSKVSDLSPLKGMPLISLDCSDTKVADLSPLGGMPLTSLDASGTQVSDLTPLNGMSLTYAGIPVKNITKGMDVLRRMTSLGTIGFHSQGAGLQRPLESNDFWEKYDAGGFK